MSIGYRCKSTAADRREDGGPAVRMMSVDAAHGVFFVRLRSTEGQARWRWRSSTRVTRGADANGETD